MMPLLDALVSRPSSAAPQATAAPVAGPPFAEVLDAQAGVPPLGDHATEAVPVEAFAPEGGETADLQALDLGAPTPSDAALLVPAPRPSAPQATDAAPDPLAAAAGGGQTEGLSLTAPEGPPAPARPPAPPAGRGVAAEALATSASPDAAGPQARSAAEPESGAGPTSPADVAAAQATGPLAEAGPPASGSETRPSATRRPALAAQAPGGSISEPLADPRAAVGAHRSPSHGATPDDGTQARTASGLGAAPASEPEGLATPQPVHPGPPRTPAKAGPSGPTAQPTPSAPASAGSTVAGADSTTQEAAAPLQTPPQGSETGRSTPDRSQGAREAQPGGEPTFPGERRPGPDARPAPDSDLHPAEPTRRQAARPSEADASDATARDAPRPDATPREPSPLAGPLSPSAPATAASAAAMTLAEAMDEAVPEPSDPEVTVPEAGSGAALSSDRSAPAGSTQEARAAVPARLAVPAWAERLAEARGGKAVQVALGEDGTVRLQTVRDGDGVTVSLRFSDPDLQTLAGTHAARLRDVLDAHFDEPVRLSLSDGGGAHDGAHPDGRPADHAGGRPSRTPSPAPSASAAPVPAPPTATVRSGRREWVG